MVTLQLQMNYPCDNRDDDALDIYRYRNAKISKVNNDIVFETTLPIFSRVGAV